MGNVRLKPDTTYVNDHFNAWSPSGSGLTIR